MTKGIMELETGNYADAIGFFKQAAAAKPVERNAAISLGIAYGRSGDLAKAEEILQQVVAAEPSNSRAKYELALVLRKAGKVQKAQELFNAVAASGQADEALKSAAQAQMDQAAPGTAKPRFSTTALAGIEYDSNVILEPSVPVTVAGKNKADWSGLFLLDASYRFLERGTLQANAAYQFYKNIYQNLAEFNVLQHGPRLGVQQALGRGALGLNYGFSYTLVGSHHYSNEHTALLFLDQRFTPASQTQFRYRMQDQFYYASDAFLLNGDRSGVVNSLGVTHTVKTGSVTLIGSYDFSLDGARKDYWSFTGHKILAGIQTEAAGLQFSGSASYTDQHYDAVYPGYPAKRHDGMQEYLLSVSKTLGRSVTITLSDSYTINDSNLAAFEYTRNIAGLFIGARL
ncbi:MAG: tetratricopeptide repeat protein [Nitrospiraceae bacterium]|nr:tetratricopeptide repeat protein [Nitrospiraceae bacterium]